MVDGAWWTTRALPARSGSSAGQGLKALTGPQWPDIEALLPARDPDVLMALLGKLDDAGRKPLVKPMRAYSRSGDFNMAPRGSEFSLSLIGAAVLPDARSVGAWLRRFPPTHPTEQLSRTQWPDTEGRLVEVLLRRRPGWVQTLISELAERLRFDRFDRGPFELVDGLRRGLGLDPPTAAGFVFQWVYYRWPRDDGTRPTGAARAAGAAALAAEPGIAALIPLIFQEDDAAFYLRRPDYLAGILAEPLVDRESVLDAALARLQRGGRPGPTNDFAAVLAALSPSDEEVAARLADYVALLSPGSASTVAGQAQLALLSANAAGLVSSADILTASSLVLARSEKKILRAQLAWLEKRAAQHPEDAAAIAAAVQIAATSNAADIQQRAAKLLGGVGQVPPERDAVELPTLPTPQQPRSVQPIEDLDEAVEKLLEILRSATSHDIGLDFERLLESLPRLAGTGGTSLREVRHRFADDTMYSWFRNPPDYVDATTPRHGLAAVVATLMGDGWEPPRTPTNKRASPAPDWALATRAFDLASSLGQDERVRVVSLPTDESGALDPAVLDARLRDAQTTGWTPAPRDLEQAQLRAHAELRPAPIVTVDVRTVGGDTDPDWPDWAAQNVPRTLTRLRIAPAASDVIAPDTLWSILLSQNIDPFSLGWFSDGYFDAWPLLLPHHPDVIAAHLVPSLAMPRPIPSIAAFTRIASSALPAAEAMEVALAHLLNAGDAQAQAAAVDGYLSLSARGHLQGTTLGSRLAAMVIQGEVTARRLPGPLGQAALAGAAADVWRTLHQLLATLLTDGEPVTGMADLLSCATSVAEHVDSPQPIPGLSDLANRTGKTQQVLQARRLMAVLTAPP